MAETKLNEKNYDYIVIGSGVAGLASAQYAARGVLKTLVVDISIPGGQALTIPVLENYPGLFPAVSGIQFCQNMAEQAKSFGAEIIQSEVLSIDKIDATFKIETPKEKFSAYSILIATGAEHKKLGVPGVLIAMASWIFLACQSLDIGAWSKAIGAASFSVGLVAVIGLQANLYTGKIGYVNSKQSAIEAFVILAINLISAFLIGLLYRACVGTSAAMDPARG